MGIKIEKGNRLQIEKKNQDFSFNSLLNKEILIFGSSLKSKHKEAFYSELDILLSSGMDIRSSMELIIEGQKKEKLKRIYQSVFDNLLNGDSFNEALAKNANFSNYECLTIKIGEETGRINVILKDLAQFYKKKIRQRKQITGSLTYPIVVLMTAILAVVFMMNYMVPMFKDIFTRFGGELPAITQFIISASESFSSNLLFTVLILITIVILHILLKRKARYRQLVSSLALNIPLIGEMIRKTYLVRFCHAMSLLVSSKIPLLQAVQLVKKMIHFYSYEKALQDIEEEILHGQLLYESMSNHSIFDKRTVSLVKVGEEVNKLDEIFDKMYDQYSTELEHRIGIISSLMEPIIIVLIGLFVAVILIAMYLPMFQMGSTIY